MAKAAAPSPPKSFESALAELETLVQAMEAGKLGLEESLATYRRGTELLRYCRQSLDSVEQQVRVLEGDAEKDLPPAAGHEG
jgi:exodeoxyribonuclease VII small subunit